MGALRGTLSTINSYKYYCGSYRIKMTSQSPRIYTYKITFEEVPYYYYGVHKEKVFGEEYWGSPYTHRWCWELYTPKKQILQLFDFTDEGWLKANLVEDRLIKLFYQTDKWCLNESCGSRISLEIKRNTGRKVGLQHKENKTAIFALTPEERIENGKIYGKISGKISYEMKVGVHNLTPEQRTINGKKGGAISGKNNRVKNLFYILSNFNLNTCSLIKLLTEE